MNRAGKNTLSVDDVEFDFTHFEISVSLSKTPSGKVLVIWPDTTIVRSLTFSLLDRNRRPIRMEIINREPAQASLRLTTKTEFYRVVIEYTSGQTETVEGSV